MIDIVCALLFVVIVILFISDSCRVKRVAAEDQSLEGAVGRAVVEAGGGVAAEENNLSGRRVAAERGTDSSNNGGMQGRGGTTFLMSCL